MGNPLFLLPLSIAICNKLPEGKPCHKPVGWFVAPVTVVMTCDGDWWRQRIWKKCYYASYPHIQIKRWLVWNSFLLHFIPILTQQPDTGTPLLVDLVENLGIIVKGNDCIQPRNHGSLLPLSRSCPEAAFLRNVTTYIRSCAITPNIHGFSQSEHMAPQNLMNKFMIGPAINSLQCGE